MWSAQSRVNSLQQKEEDSASNHQAQGSNIWASDVLQRGMSAWAPISRDDTKISSQGSQSASRATGSGLHIDSMQAGQLQDVDHLFSSMEALVSDEGTQASTQASSTSQQTSADHLPASVDRFIAAHMDAIVKLSAAQAASSSQSMRVAEAIHTLLPSRSSRDGEDGPVIDPSTEDMMAAAFSSLAMHPPLSLEHPPPSGGIPSLTMPSIAVEPRGGFGTGQQGWSHHRISALPELPERNSHGMNPPPYTYANGQLHPFQPQAQPQPHRAGHSHQYPLAPPHMTHSQMNFPLYLSDQQMPKGAINYVYPQLANHYNGAPPRLNSQSSRGRGGSTSSSSVRNPGEIRYLPPPWAGADWDPKKIAEEQQRKRNNNLDDDEGTGVYIPKGR